MTDNTIIRKDGATAGHLQESLVTVDDSGGINIPTGQTYNINGSPHTHESSGGGLDPSGWQVGSGTWTYASADDPTFVISVNADMTGVIGVGMRIKLTQTTAKYFIVTAVGAYTGGSTAITVYGGTDYDLADAAITNPYYSPVKAPLGFPLSPDKWQVEVADTSDRNQASPTQGVWYNLGSLTISVPIGAWLVSYKALLVSDKSSVTIIGASATLSTANNSESDADFTTNAYSFGASGDLRAWGQLYIEKPLILAAKASYYLNALSKIASAAALDLRGDIANTIIRARCAYL